MMNSIFSSCILCVTLSWSITAREHQDEEFCISEVFKPSCNDGEIIVILEAHFGRKQIGRCLQDDEGLTETNLKDERYIRCYNDVKANLASKCSGRTSCEVRVAELSSPKSCYNYLKSYLGVVYRCIKMTKGDKNCIVSLNGEHPQYLPLGMLVSKTGCGNHFKPWIVETLKGQKISAILEDFSISERNRTAIQKKNWFPLSNCNDKLGYIAERTENRNITICMYENNNTQLFNFLSKSNVIDVVTIRDVKERILALKLEAIGCSDLIPPADAWLKRTENEATIGCYSTRLRWQLKCIEQRWIGVIGNCSYGTKQVHSFESGSKVPQEKNNHTVALITIGMCGVVVSLLIACVGLICIKKWHVVSKSKDFSLKMENSTAYSNGTMAQHQDRKTLMKTAQYFPNDDINISRDCQQYYELEQPFNNKNSA